MCTV